MAKPKPPNAPRILERRVRVLEENVKELADILVDLATTLKARP